MRIISLAILLIFSVPAFSQKHMLNIKNVLKLDTGKESKKDFVLNLIENEYQNTKDDLPLYYLKLEEFIVSVHQGYKCSSGPWAGVCDEFAHKILLEMIGHKKHSLLKNAPKNYFRDLSIQLMVNDYNFDEKVAEKYLNEYNSYEEVINTLFAIGKVKVNIRNKNGINESAASIEKVKQVCKIALDNIKDERELYKVENLCAQKAAELLSGGSNFLGQRDLNSILVMVSCNRRSLNATHHLGAYGFIRTKKISESDEIKSDKKRCIDFYDPRSNAYSLNRDELIRIYTEEDHKQVPFRVYQLLRHDSDVEFKKDRSKVSRQ